MPTIDQENAKQIRQPMDVLITMPLAADDISLTFSGYSTAKVADGVLNKRTWPMRKLADLQGVGFELDGSAVLYDPNTTASQANGKLGVRSNVGETVSVTVTGSKSIPALSISVTGAASVTYNGITKPITGSTVSVPVLTTSITLSFEPASETERIEISNIEPESDFVINNENLIRATVSLRSDLSLFDQTLPESEINIEAYHPVDVAEDVANIPADTPITYSAGYPGDMSPERKFYVAGQVTWADNVLTIQGVDAVHFLDDINIVAPVTQKDSDYFANSAKYVLDMAGISYNAARWSIAWWSGAYRWIIPENTNARAWLAFLNQCFNLTDDTGRLIDGSATLPGRLQFAYIDAGIPTLRTYHTANDFEIDETDCADVIKEIDQKYGVVTTNWKRLIKEDADTGEGSIFKVGSATFQKNVGTSLSFDHYTEWWEIGIFLGRNYDNEIAEKLQAKYQTIFGFGYTLAVVPCDTDGNDAGFSALINPPYVGYKLLIGEIPQEEAKDYPAEEGQRYDYSSFVPWAAKYNGWRYDNNASHLIKTSTQMWNVLKNAKIIDADAESIDLDIYGFAYVPELQQKTYTVDAGGAVYDYGDAPLIGRVAAQKTDSTTLVIYPGKMLMAPMYRSKIKGSFTWKGDPRIQPRSHGQFKRKDGTIEDITLENITLIHEEGGLYSEITYRKGII